MKFTANYRAPPERVIAPAAQRYLTDLRQAQIIAIDRATRDAHAGVQERVSGTGLGRLSRAVGYSSLAKKLGGLRGQSAQVRSYLGQRSPYGVIFAKGGDKSRAGGALEAYSRGVTIRPQAGNEWLAIPTRAVPRLVSVNGRRQRNTPDLYRRSGLASTIGPLEFRPLAGGQEAIWVIKRVSISPKTGQAKKLGPRAPRSRIAQKEVIAFVGIRLTKRAQRFNHLGVVGFYGRRVPLYIERALAEVRGRQ